MASSNYKNHVSQELDKKHKRILALCIKEEGNRSCADCGCRGPTWASVNLGVFVCLACSGIHRSLGVHISQVRSTTLDTWLPKQVSFVTSMGNQKANRYWERRLPRGFNRPSDGPSLKAFIRNKYVDKMYVPHDMPPPGIENYQSHPYCMDEKTPVAEVTPSPKKHTSPSLNSSPAGTIPTVETARKTQLVIQSKSTGDFLSLGDDATSNPSASKAVGNSDWEPFIGGGSPLKVEKSAQSWNAFETDNKPTATQDLLSTAPALSADPFGLDGLPPTPKDETIPAAEAPTNGQQSTEDILKLYDIPKKAGEPVLPPNLGLPMGPTQGLYPHLPPVQYPPSYGGYPPQMQNGGHLYPQIAMPNMQTTYGTQGYGQGAVHFNPAGGYPPPQSFYRQGPK